MSTRFLHAGQGNVTVAFSVFSQIFFILILEMRLSQNCVSLPGGVSEKTHENLRRYSNKTYEVVVIYMNKQQIVGLYSADPLILSWPSFFNRNIYHVCHTLTTVLDRLRIILPLSRRHPRDCRMEMANIVMELSLSLSVSLSFSFFFFFCLVNFQSVSLGFV